MSNLLSQASLVMIPSGYKEDVVYSPVPTDGSGDLSFTRASNGTRVNSAGLVEVCPWNLVQYSEQFTNGVWAIKNGTFTDNFATAPNGTQTACKWQATDSDPYIYQSFNGDNVTYTATCWIKATGTAIGKNCSIRFGGTVAYSVMTGDWQQLTLSANINGSVNVGVEAPESATSGEIVYIWGFQLNIGSTAKPYFPTTDRLNVPRLTYQNGGGGCPSLLLEKQSTNLVSYSQDFTNSYWSKLGQGVGDTAVVTANYAISPDGTQNATRFVCNLNGGTTSSDRSWMIASFTAQATSTISIWIKLNSAGTKTVLLSDSGGGTKTISGTDWQRIDATFVGAGGEFRIGLIGGSTSDTLDCCIWGAQAESGSYPTSYIPTTGSSATRVADVATVNLPNTNMTFTAYLELDEASLGTAAGDWFSIYSNVSVLGRAYGYANTFGFADAYNLGVVSGAKMVWKQESGSTAKIFKGGALVGTSTTGTYTDPFNRLRMDGALLDKPIKIKQFVFFDNALTDAECIQLTA